MLKNTCLLLRKTKNQWVSSQENARNSVSPRTPVESENYWLQFRRKQDNVGDMFGTIFAVIENKNGIRKIHAGRCYNASVVHHCSTHFI